jgi:histone H3/H4
MLTMHSGETGELRALMDSRRQSEPSGVFDTGGSPGTDGEPTFVFRIPERRRDTLPQPDIRQDDTDAARGAEHADDWSDIEEAETTSRPLRRESLQPIADEVHPNARKPATAARKRKELKVSRFGIEYPSLPPTVIKRLASTFSRSYGGSGKLNKETVESISQASDWFFEQVAEDLSSYADHARRKTIEEADVIALMKRYVFPFLFLLFYEGL